MSKKRHPPSNAEDREQMEAYATFRYFGDTNAEASAKVGVSTRTGSTWEAQDWWRTLIVDRVERLHVSKLISKARRVVDNTIEAGLHPEATIKDRTLAFKASQWMLERQDAQFADRTERAKTLGGRNLAELSVSELRALARAADANMLEEAPRVEPEFPEVEVLPGRPEPSPERGPRVVSSHSKVYDALARADRDYEGG